MLKRFSFLIFVLIAFAISFLAEKLGLAEHEKAFEIIMFVVIGIIVAFYSLICFFSEGTLFERIIEPMFFIISYVAFLAFRKYFVPCFLGKCGLDISFWYIVFQITFLANGFISIFEKQECSEEKEE